MAFLVDHKISLFNLPAKLNVSSLKCYTGARPSLQPSHFNGMVSNNSVDQYQDLMLQHFNFTR